MRFYSAFTDHWYLPAESFAHGTALPAVPVQRFLRLCFCYERNYLMIGMPTWQYAMILASGTDLPQAWLSGQKEGGVLLIILKRCLSNFL